MALLPAIDYTNKDYAALRQAMLDLARYRLPEWTDQSASDLGTLLVDLFAYMGDVVLYYQDRIANESFLPTATERRSVLHLLRLIGYELKPPVAASADLTLIFNTPAQGDSPGVTIPHAAQFATRGSPVQTFEYLGPDLQVDLSSAQVQAGAPGKFVYRGLPVRQSRSLDWTVLGSSTGEPSLRFPLAQGPLIVESLQVQVDAGAGPEPWQRRDDLLYHTDADGRVTLSGADSTDYTVQFDESGVAWVLFGDGVYGMRPPIGTNNIRVRYAVGGGAIGNVQPGAISDPKTTVRLLDSVSNPGPAFGGSDAETIDHAVRFGPLAFRSSRRAVTLDDFVALAQQAGGVAKVRARARSWNQVDLFVAPEGESCGAAPAELKQRLIAYFEDKRMVGTFVHIQDPTCVSIDINITVVPKHHFNPESVRQAVDTAVRDLLAFRNVDFAQTLYLSKIYEAAEALPGVFAATVTRFRRADRPVFHLERLRSLALGGLFDPPRELIEAITGEVVPSGRIDIDEFEIPQLGTLNVTPSENPR